MQDRGLWGLSLDTPSLICSACQDWFSVIFSEEDVLQLKEKTGKLLFTEDSQIQQWNILRKSMFERLLILGSGLIHISTSKHCHEQIMVPKGPSSGLFPNNIEMWSWSEHFPAWRCATSPGKSDKPLASSDGIALRSLKSTSCWAVADWRSWKKCGDIWTLSKRCLQACFLFFLRNKWLWWVSVVSSYPFLWQGGIGVFLYCFLMPTIFICQCDYSNRPSNSI